MLKDKIDCYCFLSGIFNLNLFFLLLDFKIFCFFFFFSSRRRHTRSLRDWSSDVCSSDLHSIQLDPTESLAHRELPSPDARRAYGPGEVRRGRTGGNGCRTAARPADDVE